MFEQLKSAIPLCKELRQNPAHPGRGAVNPFPFFVSYFPLGFFKLFLFETALVTSGVLE